MGALFAMAMSGSVHLNVEVIRRPRYSLYTGAFAASLFVLAGSDDVVEETYRGVGTVLGARIRCTARCAEQMCNDGASFVSLDVAYRLHFHLF